MAIFDVYSILHFLVGIVAYYIRLPLPELIIFHMIYEVISNSKHGRKFIKEYVEWWPGGSDDADPPLDSLGDTVSTLLGWVFAHSYLKLKRIGS